MVSAIAQETCPLRGRKRRHSHWMAEQPEGNIRAARQHCITSGLHDRNRECDRGWEARESSGRKDEAAVDGEKQDMRKHFAVPEMLADSGLDFPHMAGFFGVWEGGRRRGWDLAALYWPACNQVTPPNAPERLTGLV